MALQKTFILGLALVTCVCILVLIWQAFVRANPESAPTGQLYTNIIQQPEALNFNADHFFNWKIQAHVDAPVFVPPPQPSFAKPIQLVGTVVAQNPSDSIAILRFDTQMVVISEQGLLDGYTQLKSIYKDSITVTHKGYDYHFDLHEKFEPNSQSKTQGIKPPLSVYGYMIRTHFSRHPLGS
tara:strand:- start:7 stop:552 length:546 start_codon:yes stop_codon:yes gene_type:complete